MRTALILILVTVPYTGVAHADLVCEKPTLAPGELRSGQKPTASFVVRNTGSTHLSVAEVKASCGCLLARISTDQLDPGQAATVTVEVNTVTQSPGPQAWRVAVRFHQEGHGRELHLTATAHVIPEFTLSPATLVVRADQPVRHTFTLTERRATPLTLRIPPSRTIRAVAGQPSRTPEGDWARTIEVEILPGGPEGTRADALVLLTSDPEFPEFRVPLTVVRRARKGVRALPAEVTVSGRKGEPVPSRVILLEATDDGPVEVESVESGSPALSCSWATGPGTRSTLRLTIDGNKVAGGTFEGSLRVVLRRPAGATITVPVRGSWR